MDAADRVMWLAIRRGVLRIAASTENRAIARGLEEIAGAIAVRWGIERQPSRRERKRQGAGGGEYTKRAGV